MYYSIAYFYPSYYTLLFFYIQKTSKLEKSSEKNAEKFKKNFTKSSRKILELFLNTVVYYFRKGYKVCNYHGDLPSSKL